MSDEDRLGGQAHFLLLPSDNVQIDFNNFYSKVNQRERGQKCRVISDIPGAGWQANTQDALIIAPSTGKTIAGNCRANEALGIDHVLSDVSPSAYFAENYMSGITVNWDINDKLSFKSVSGFRGTRVRSTSDLDGMAIPLLYNTAFGSESHASFTDQLSQEFQLSGTAFDERLNFVGGIFGYSEKSRQPNGLGVTGPFFGALFNPSLAYYNNTLSRIKTDNSSVSAFAQADWKIDNQWSVTAGIRYTRESRELERVQDAADPATFTNDGSAVFSPIPGFYQFPNGAISFNPNPGYVHVVTPFGAIADINDQSNKVHDSAWTPMFSVQRTLEDVGFIETGSVYATISKGFLSGGISDSLNPITQTLPTYKPEKVTNYEVGLKFDAFDRRLRVNTALFYLDYRDRQLTSLAISNDGRVAGIPINAAKSSITGIEIESQFIPIDNLEITANVTFNHGDIGKFDDHRIVTRGSLPGSNCTPLSVGGVNVDYCNVDRSDENLPRLPQAIYFLAAQYTFHTGIGDIIPRVQWSMRTDVENCFDRASCLSGAYLGNQRDVGARLTWSSPDKRWGAAAYGTNLLNQRYIIGGIPLVDVTQTGGMVYNDPRMYGIEAHYSW
jgi:iron complex outermembrane recepter protein